MTACPGSNKTQVCPQRHTCALHQAYLGLGRGPVSLASMPLSAADGCYMYEPAGIREAVRQTQEREGVRA